MLKKLAAVIVLITAGLSVLYVSIGGSFLGESHAGRSRPLTSEEPAVSAVVPIDTEKGKTELSVLTRGYLKLPSKREVELPNGDRKLLTVYEIVAKDSRPVDATVAKDVDYLMQLLDVTVTFFDEVVEAGEPTVVRVATLLAKEAYVQLGRDAEGHASVEEDRDMDLRDVVLVSEPSARVKDLRLTVDQVLVRHDEAGLRLQTPTDHLPFTLTIGPEGDRTEVTGNGLKATIPPEGDDAAGPMKLHITSHPELRRDGLTITAVGSLDYVEDQATGHGHVVVEDEVAIRSVRDGEPIVANGELLIGDVIRRRTKEPGASSSDVSMSWLSIHLENYRSKLPTLVGNGFELDCDTLDIGPSIGGEPALIVASGGRPTMVQTKPDGGKVFIRADTRIDLLRVSTWAGALHPVFRPELTSPLAHELFVFHGESSLRDEQAGLVLEATEGLKVLRSNERLGLVLGRGFGDVKVERDGLEVVSNLGFELAQNGTTQRIRLGPELPSPRHRYEITQDRDGDGDAELRVTGHGFCSIVQTPGAVSEVTLRSPLGDIDLRQGGDRLLDVEQLTATFRDEVVLGFDARGTKCRIERTTPDQRVEGFARRISSADGKRARLYGEPDQPATLLSTELGADASGLEIEIEPVGDDVALSVRGDDEVRARVVLVGGEDRPIASTVDLQADDLVITPYRVTPWVRELQLRSGLRHELPNVGRTRYIRASGDVVVDSDSERGETSAEGEQLWLEVHETADATTAAGVLLGPTAVARLEHKDPQDRVTIALSRRVRFLFPEIGEEELELSPSADLDPILEVRSPGSSSGAGFHNTRVTCGGAIRVQPDRIDFDGPVHVRGLTDTGVISSDGPDVTAENLHLLRDPTTHDVTQVHAAGDARLEWSRISGRGERLFVDLVTADFEVSDPRGAQVRLPDGPEVRADTLSGNYRDRTLRATRWRLSGTR